MKRFTFLGCVLGLLMASFSGCAGPTTIRHEAPGPMVLDAWLENEALPKIREGLENNSFMKGKSFIIVKAKGEAVGQNISHQIDILTEDIREKMTSYLLERPGIKIIRRHPVPLLGRPYRLQELKCGGAGRHEMLLVVDVARIGPMEKNIVRVNMRAVDLRKDDWIKGFSLYKDLALTSQQSMDLNTIHPDEYLRGTKYIPFLDSQREEMGAYLARNLSCLFREGYLGEDLKVFVDLPKVKRKNRDILWFVEKQLQYCNEIQLVSSRERADWVIIADSKGTGPESKIGQFWVEIFDQKGEEVKGLATYAYFVTGEDRPAPIAGQWKILNLPAKSTFGFMEIRKTSGSKYHGNLFEPDGSTLRQAGISIKAVDNTIEWSYFDEKMQKTLVVNGVLIEDREKMAVKVRTFPATEMPFEQELVLVH